MSLLLPWPSDSAPHHSHFGNGTGTNGTMGRADSARRMACLFDVEFDAAVVTTTFVGVVRGDRLRLAEALAADTVLLETVLREPPGDRRSSRRGQLLVRVLVALVVGVTVDADLR